MKIYYKKKISKPDIVFFDLDNTLYNYVKSHKQAIKKVKASILRSHNLPKKKFNFFFKKAKNIIKSQLGNTASSHNRLIYFQKLFEILNHKKQASSALKFEKIYWKNFLKNSYLMPGLKKFLINLKKNKIKTGIITDLTSQIQFKKIVYFKIEKYFDNITTSEEVMYDKPNKKIYLLSLKKFRRRKVIWMIGDDLTRDIKGSKKSIKAITFHKVNNFYKKYHKIKPDFAFKHYWEINKFFNRNINHVN
jgi:putative hydrolase of the HAD superfamily